MTASRRRSEEPDPIRRATTGALAHVIDPLVGLMFDAGVTVQEFNHILRNRAVHAAAGRVTRESGSCSKSRIAIMTGLPRSEVTRILGSISRESGISYGQHPARRVLAAWYDNPHFLTVSGEPAALPIFGKRRSFERLVAMHGAGIPVRAMLDELTQINAVQRLADQKVRAISRVPISTGLTPIAIAAVGERCRDLLRTLTKNVRLHLPPLFEATALTSDADPEMVPILRRELAEQGASFINAANSLLKRSRYKRGGNSTISAAKRRLGVTVYYFEEELASTNDHTTNLKVRHRKNLRRQQRPKKKVGHKKPSRKPLL
jgi:hypothetical protein